jgi:HK97 family phage major capsid protein
MIDEGHMIYLKKRAAELRSFAVSLAGSDDTADQVRRKAARERAAAVEAEIAWLESPKGQAEIEYFEKKDRQRLARAAARKPSRAPVKAAAPARAAPVRPAPAPRPWSETRRRIHMMLDGEALADPERLLSLGFAQVRDQALRTLETRGQHLPPSMIDRVDALCRTRTAMCDAKLVARRIAVLGSEVYERAFAKALSPGFPAWDEPEKAAITAAREIQVAEARAAGEGSGSIGGYGIPVFIDPSVMLTVQDSAEIWGYAKIVPTTTDAWKGVSSTGATISFEAEASTVPDAALTLAQPTIPIYKASSVITASIETSQDYPGFVNELGGLFNGAWQDQISNYTAVGSGSSVPLGLFTAMSASTTSPSHITTTTAGQLTGGDVRKVFASLPERYLSNASWLLSPTMRQQISAQAAPDAISGLPAHDWVPGRPGPGGYPPLLMGRPVITSSYAPAFTSTTGSANIAVVGDMSRFVIPLRIGATVEVIPEMFDFSGGTGRPTGQRGFLF